MTSPEKPWYTSIIREFLISDCVGVVGNPAAFSRDWITIARRIASEGEAFLTKTLPNFGKVLDLALQARGPMVQTYFKRRSKTSALPAFLQGLLVHVFADNGDLLQQPRTDCIRLLRQLCFWFKKLERGYSDKSLRQAAEELIATDAALPDTRTIRLSRDLAVAQALVTWVLRKLDLGNLLPKHGPGAVAGGEGIVGKRFLHHSFEDLEKVFRPIPFMFSLRDAAEDPQRVYGRTKCKFGLSRIAFVEKDSSGPRVIGLEPAEYQWCQQALKRALYDHLENQPVTRGHINFTDQGVNCKLALDWRRYDTLDMSKASDRNSLALVEYLFKRTRVLPWLLASRTPGTILPDGRILFYKKFAPMGSATCFPVEALVFWALAVAALHRAGFPLFIAARHVYVYGDDLIVPHGYFVHLRHVFEQVGLKFNDSKCCISGKFRESCGLDAYDGVEVTPVRYHRSRLTHDLTSFIPSIEHANALFIAGYWGAAKELRRLLEYSLKKNFQVVLPETLHPLPVLHWLGLRNVFRIRVKGGIPLVNGWMVEPRRVAAPAVLERNCLRESLSLGGPVGQLSARSPGERSLAQKYSFVARKRWVVYPGNSTSQESTLGDRINLLAKSQQKVG